MVIKHTKDAEFRISLPFIYFNIILDPKWRLNGLIFFTYISVLSLYFFQFRYKLAKIDKNKSPLNVSAFPR